MADPASDYSFEVVKTLRTDQQDDSNRIDLQVIRWNRTGKAVLEKRRIYVLKNGTLRMRKLVGMNTDDLKFIGTHLEEIERLLDE